MFSSTIIPTIGRPKLNDAVQSVLEQSFSAEPFEIIVVNDSGRPLPKAAWQQDPRAKILHTIQRERCVARNLGAAAARGKFLHFLDDDDWLLPDGLQTLYELAQGSSADIIYGGTQLVDRQRQPIIQLDHNLHGNCFVQTMAGEWIPPLSSLFRTEAFMAVGGYDPLTLVSEDVDLVRRLTLNGSLRGTSMLVAAAEFGDEGSSSQQHKRAFYSHRARERILSEPGVFARLRDSAETSYWHGRIVRLYVTSALYNIKQRQPANTISRFLHAVGATVAAIRHVFSADFYFAILKPYESPTFARAFAAKAAQQYQ